MEFVPELGGWQKSRAPPLHPGVPLAANRNLASADPETRGLPPNYPPRIDKWRERALRATSQNLSFGTVSADGGGTNSGTGAPVDGWSPVSADGILFTGGRSVSQAEPDHYARQERARKERLAEERSAAHAARMAGNVALKGGWPVDQNFKRLSPRSHYLFGPLPVTN